MALVIISGLPTSGKTHRARELVAAFEHNLATDPPPRIRHIHHISEHTLGLVRSAFASAATEKQHRAAVYSAAKRALARDAVVVLDAGNYIKGYRYQLYCEAKNAGLRSAVVYVGTTADQARQVNAVRAAAAGAAVDGAAELDPYASRTWEELVARFEEPNDMARWDRPLFAVLWGDAPLGAGVAQRVWDEVVLGRGRDGRVLERVKPNAATVLPPAAAADHLHELDRATQGVLLRLQEGVEEGAAVRVGEGVVQLPPRPVGAAELQRLRRQFVGLHRQQMGGMGLGGVGAGGGRLEAGRVAGLFVDWLNDQFGA